MDWSKEVLPGADLSDLDEEAIAYARKMFTTRKKTSEMKTEMLEKRNLCICLMDLFQELHGHCTMAMEQ
ncbi:MAG: hypothetical protein PHW47_12340 [Lachnospira sp.]|nr:hypothetical protein [Lachnospira sp.]